MQKALKSSHWSQVRSLKDACKDEPGEILIMRAKLPELKKNYNCLYITEENHFLQINIAPSLINNLSDFNSDKLINYGFIEYPLENLKKDFFLVLKINTKNYNVISSVLLGSQFQIEKDIFYYSFWNLSFAIIILFISILLIIANLSIIHSNLILGISCFLLSMSFFILSNLPFLHLIFDHPRLFYHMEYISLMALACSLFFVAEKFLFNYKEYIQFLFGGTLLFLFISIIFVSLNLITYTQILPFFISWLVLGIAIYLVILLLDNKAAPKKDKIEKILLLIGGGGFFVSTFLELADYFFKKTNCEYGYCVSFIQYGTIWLIIILLLIEVLKVRNIKRQKNIAMQKAYKTLERENSLHEQFNEKLIEFKEEERNRIAIELHDSIGQNLLIIRNKILILIPNEKDEVTKKSLAQISSLAGSTIQEARDISQNLSPRLLNQLGLDAAIDSLIELYKKTYNIDYIISIENIDNYIKPEHKINIYRIIQESFTNIFKHSQATEIVLCIKKVEAIIYFDIKDNGIGVRYLKVNEYTGLGIYGMNRRAKIIGGEFTIGLSPTGGTEIQLIYPIKDKNQQDIMHK